MLPWFSRTPRRRCVYKSSRGESLKGEHGACGQPFHVFITGSKDCCEIPGTCRIVNGKWWEKSLCAHRLKPGENVKKKIKYSSGFPRNTNGTWKWVCLLGVGAGPKVCAALKNAFIHCRSLKSRTRTYSAVSGKWIKKKNIIKDLSWKSRCTSIQMEISRAGKKKKRTEVIEGYSADDFWC